MVSTVLCISVAASAASLVLVVYPKRMHIVRCSKHYRLDVSASKLLQAVAVCTEQAATAVLPSACLHKKAHCCCAHSGAARTSRSM
jgi:hypothetical protein